MPESTFQDHTTSSKNDTDCRLAQTQRRLQEAFDQLWDSFVDPTDPLYDRDGVRWDHLSANAHTTSSHLGSITDETQLASIRHRCRTLATTNEFAINGHEKHVAQYTNWVHRGGRFGRKCAGKGGFCTETAPQGGADPSKPNRQGDGNHQPAGQQDSSPCKGGGASQGNSGEGLGPFCGFGGLGRLIALAGWLAGLQTRQPNAATGAWLSPSPRPGRRSGVMMENLMVDEHPTFADRVGRAFVRAAEDAPELRAACEQANKAMKRWAAFLEVMTKTPEYKKIEGSRQAAIREFADAIGQSLGEMNDYLVSNHLPTANTIEKWVHLARVVEAPVPHERLTLRKVLEHAEVWLDREKAREGIRQDVAAGRNQGTVPQPIEIAAASPQDGGRSSSPSKPQKQKKPVKLSHWAIGLDGDTWWLFQWFGNHQKWRERGKIDLPRGMPTTLAKAMAENGGSISKSRTISLFRTGNRTAWSDDKVFNDTCKQAKKRLAKAIQTAIHRVSQCDVNDDPIPFDAEYEAWRGAVQVGFGGRDDRNELQFQTLEQVEQGDYGGNWRPE